MAHPALQATAADRVIAVREALRRDSWARGEVFGNTFNNLLLRCMPEVCREDGIVFFGRLVSDKGVDLLLRSFAAVQRPTWHLTIIGDGPERPALEHLGVC